MRALSGSRSAYPNGAARARFSASTYRRPLSQTWHVPAWTSTAHTPSAAAVAGTPVAACYQAGVADALLQWACSSWAGPVDDGEAGPAQPRSSGAVGRVPLRVAVRELGLGRGRGLVATADVAPGETLLSVPLTRVFTSQSDSELHWSAEMGLRLLRAKQVAAAARSHLETAVGGSPAAGAQPAEEAGASAGPESLGEAGWAPWIQALPAAVRTPLEYGEEEIRQLGCPYVMEEILGMQQCVRDCYEVLQPQLEELGCGWEDFLWAVQVFHSRCFFEPNAGLHMCVPGVDMANHSAAPNAQVRVQHSPGACQGYDALAEVAEPPPPEPSRFNLVAGEAGIRRGEEVTISYGGWPSEGFLLLFGFVPAAVGTGGTVEGAGGGGGGGDGSPGDCLTLFKDAEEAVRWCIAAAAASGAAQQQPSGPGVVPDSSVLNGSEDDEELVEVIVQTVADALPGDPLVNFVVTPEGFESRLLCLLQVAVTAGRLGLGPRDLLLGRLRERLAHFDNSGPQHGNEAVSQFVRSKSSVAKCVLQQLVGL